MRLNSAVSPLELWIFKYYRFVHGARIALAFVMMLAITRLLDIPDSTWPLITLVVVMGPISYWGNVFPRAIQRVLGTCIGAASGMVALYLETFSTPLLMLWCAIIMFLCGYLALGKRPYAGLLIGITLAVVLGAHSGEFEQALWRSGDVIFGSAFALLCCSIFPQRAFIHWRLNVSEHLLQIATLHHTLLSPNVVERPRLQARQKEMLGNIIRNRSLVSPSAAETHLSSSLLSSIQSSMVNCLYTVDKLSDIYWQDRHHHLALIQAKSLKISHQATEKTLYQLSHMLKTGEIEGGEWHFDNMNEAIEEVKSLLDKSQHDTSLYGYVWLNVQLIEELAKLRRMIMLALNLTKSSNFT
ncbi:MULTISPECIES: FUSC family protein [Vibrio]|uniref:FUSC family protein n=1 Tax=Vibrio algicola TaxID=2662262 RepID=A0A5Q0TES4_9VIBR|nr:MULTISPECIES: FUSC family protein [Vibrio]MBD1575259.1 FUSC family protein [Vibrio sp. S11_S32]